jgi:hypothetical protein
MAKVFYRHPLPEPAALERFFEHPLVASLAALHPNSLGQESSPIPEEWKEWWDWAAQFDPAEPNKWKAVLQAYCSGDVESKVRSLAYLSIIAFQFLRCEGPWRTETAPTSF